MNIKKECSKISTFFFYTNIFSLFLKKVLTKNFCLLIINLQRMNVRCEMILIVFKKGEISMNLKIVNKGKFTRSVVLIFLFIIGISFMIGSKSFSHTESKYKVIYVASGDTLWSIAKEEQNANNYYKDKNIRNIVDEIKKTNHLESSDLKVNQELKIKEL